MTSRVVVSLRIAAPPERVFDAFTREIDLWWVDNTLFRLTPRSPGTMAFEPANTDRPRQLVERVGTGKTFVVGEVSVWEPGRRLVVGWRCATFGPDHRTEVEVRFEPVGEETRVTVEHRGWDSVPQEHVARHGFPLMLFQQRLGEHWRKALDRLRMIVANQTRD